MKMFPSAAYIIDSVNESHNYRLLVLIWGHRVKIHTKSGIRRFRIPSGRELPLGSNNFRLPINFSFNYKFQTRVKIVNLSEFSFY